MSIERLQDIIGEMEQVDCPVVNHFSDGIYARETIIPQGVCLVGAQHKTRHFFMVVRGECYIATGEKTVNVEAPYLMETTPGTKRSIMAITDTTIMTFHVTNETDVDSIGNDILEPEQNTLPQWKRIGGLK